MASRTLRLVRDRAPLRTKTIGPGTWLVQRKSEPQLRAKVIGSKDRRTRLVFNPRGMRADMPKVHRDLGAWLLDEQLRWLLRELRINCVFDVGANVGQYAKRLRRQGYRGRILSFEPVKEFADQLREAAASDPLWDVYDYALGDEDTTTEINATPGLRLSSLQPATDFGRDRFHGLQNVTSETIRVRRLDQVIDELLAGVEDPRLYLKLDTQGYDLPVVRGCGDQLDRFAALQTEAAWLSLYENVPVMEEHLAELRGRGFDVVGMYPVSRMWKTMRVIEFDVLMVRADAFDGPPET